MKKVIILVLLFFCGLMICHDSQAQRRQKPGTMKHSDQEVVNAITEKAVNCQYISNNHTFYSEVGYGPDGTRPMKIGTATMVFKNGKYSLSFKSIKVKTTSNSWNVPRNHWWKESMFNNFTITGKFETFEKGGVTYLRLFDGESGETFHDVKLTGKNARSFELYDDGVEFNFKLQ